MLIKLLTRGFIDGLALTATTSVALMAASNAETGSPWSAVNPICHMIDGDAKEFGDKFDQRDSLFSLALNSSAMIAWATIFQFMFGKDKFPKSVASGLLTAAGAYVVDYHLVPKRFTPGIEKKISWNSIFGIYVVLGLTLGLMAKFHNRED